jgi:phosphatidyl-myo-inositol alpha-mannosyltransferase
MRIAMVSPYDLGVPGGVQEHVRRLAAALQAGGDDVAVIGPGAPTSAAQGEHRLGRSVPVPFNGAIAPVGLAPGTCRRLRRLLARLDPQVVHVHEPLVPVLGPCAVRGAPSAVVATFHAHAEQGRLHRAVRAPARRLLARADRWLAVSEVAARYHAGALGVPVARFEIVPNGVDVARFAAASGDASLRAGRPSLLYVGRLEPRKGIDVLVGALDAVAAHHPEIGLVVAGDGPMRARVARAASSSTGERVRFLGRVDDERLPGCHASADLFVAPARGGESFGIVLLEALAAGTPVVASDLPAFRAVLDDGRAGMLVPPGSSEALAAGIVRALGDPAGTARRVEAGRAVAAAHDWHEIAVRVREVYRSTQRAD